MIISCEKCDTKFRLDDSRVAHRAVKVKCTKCHNIFIVYPPQGIEEAEVQEVTSDTQAPPKGEMEGEGAQREREESREDDAGEKEASEGPVPSEASGPAADFLSESAGPQEGEEETGKETPFSEPGSSEKGSLDAGCDLEKEAAPSGRDLSEDMDGIRPGIRDLKEDFEEDFIGSRTGSENLSCDEEDTEDLRELMKGGTGDEDLEPREEGSSGGAKPPIVSGTRGGSPGEEKKTQKFRFDFDREENKGKGIAPGIRVQKTREEANFGASRMPAYEKKQGRTITRLFVLLAVIIAISAGISYFMHRNEGTQSPVEIEYLNGFYAENKTLGRVFVIEGKIRNMTEEPLEIKGIRGSVYDTGGEKIRETVVSPGRIVTSVELKNLDGEALLKPFEDASEGVLPPGANMPVMVLFTEVPERISEYAIDVIRK